MQYGVKQGSVFPVTAKGQFWVQGFQTKYSALPPFPVLGKNAGNTHHFMLYLNTLIMLRSLPKNFQMKFNPL